MQLINHIYNLQTSINRVFSSLERLSREKQKYTKGVAGARLGLDSALCHPEEISLLTNKEGYLPRSCMQRQGRAGINEAFSEDAINSTKAKRMFLPFHPSLG